MKKTYNVTAFLENGESLTFQSNERVWNSDHPERWRDKATEKVKNELHEFKKVKVVYVEPATV